MLVDGCAFDIKDNHKEILKVMGADRFSDIYYDVDILCKCVKLYSSFDEFINKCKLSRKDVLTFLHKRGLI